MYLQPQTVHKHSLAEITEPAAIFTALHGMRTRYSDENSVRQTRELWQNGRKLCSDFYAVRKNIYPSFLRRRIVGGVRPLLP